MEPDEPGAPVVVVVPEPEPVETPAVELAEIEAEVELARIEAGTEREQIAADAAVEIAEAQARGSGEEWESRIQSLELGLATVAGAVDALATELRSSLTPPPPLPLPEPEPEPVVVVTPPAEPAAGPREGPVVPEPPAKRRRVLF